ncbi:hypothetical protein ACOSP7_018635 [Xanthoceras sorbifolium]|uniref:Uncharacterized protein n=1 Tax=Xanthoceras sorbifolium TaxID=99658 RepID=A0ABQ8I1K6_9ROSI|nr:hypothetical protein JRO89_XS05G0112100 [Xanthoceras sorbifolium]
MGTCVSVHKSTDMKVAVQIESSIEEEDNTAKKHKPHITGDGFFPQTSAIGNLASFRDFSSKEDLFFDSQPWLESDCEDYLSVNGDTPSCGNSPIHQKSFIVAATPPEKILYVDSVAPNCIPEPSSTDVKRQLIELFRESFGDDAAADLQLQGQQKAKPTIVDFPSKPASPYESVPNSVCSSETTAYRGSRTPKKNKAAQSAPCCIPSLMRNLSFAERKK